VSPWLRTMKKQEYDEISRVAIEALSDLKEEAIVPLNPLNIGRFMIMPNMKVYCIAIKGPFSQDVPLKMIELAQKDKVAILSGVFSLDYSNPKIANILAFVDLTNSSLKPNDIVARLRHKGSSQHIQIFAPTRSGFVFDNFFFPLKVGNERAIIFRKPLYEAFFSGIRKEFGSAGEVFLYYMGFESGSRAFEDYKNISGSLDFMTLSKIACAFAFNMGWGIFKFQELNLKKRTLKMRLYDNFKCSSGKGAGKPYSHFLRGVSAGLYLHFFKRAGSVEETKCIAQGDAFCEFLIKPAKSSGKILHSHI
jgi:predicted hydrocarbon binding protein